MLIVYYDFNQKKNGKMAKFELVVGSRFGIQKIEKQKRAHNFF